MFAPSKMGRGGGGGGGGGGGRGTKRLIPPVPPRPAGRGGISRPPVGRGAAGKAVVAPAPAREEKFSLVSSDKLAYGMMVRLSPELLEAMKRAEAKGGSAPRIKFGAENGSENVVDVGGKEFKFTWSSEYGPCDIYEECQSEHGGSGSLVESGSVWRKLNIQRVLDESVKNHVKMRSEEAERQHRARKSIVLDPANPSVKSSARTMAAAAVEGSMRRFQFKNKNEAAFKKSKNETNQGPPKSTFISRVSPSIKKSQSSMSPHQPSPLKTGLAQSNSAGTAVRNLRAVEDSSFSLEISGKEELAGSEREQRGKNLESATLPDSSFRTLPGDLHYSLVQLLVENPKGLNLKALEKAVTERYPNSGKKIESVLKMIATFQSPGRYVLKPGVTLETIKKLPSESGSSPESVHLQTPIVDPDIETKVSTDECELQLQLDLAFEDEMKTNAAKKFDSHHYSPDKDRKSTSNNEGNADSSSGSGTESDSESDSSDSGSGSGSQSKSPAGSRSGSSSDSDSDASSSGKEASDVDVDIMMSDDEKVQKKSVDAVSTHAVDLGHDISVPRTDHILSSDFLSRPVVECEGDAELNDIEVDITGESPAPNRVDVFGKKVDLDDVSENYRHQMNSRALCEESSSSPYFHKQAENGHHFDSHRNGPNGVGRQMTLDDTYCTTNLDHGGAVDGSTEAVKLKHKRAFDQHNMPESKRRWKTESSKQQAIFTGNKNSFSEQQRGPNEVANNTKIASEILQDGQSHSELHRSSEKVAVQKLPHAMDTSRKHNDGLTGANANMIHDYVPSVEMDASSLRKSYLDNNQPNQNYVQAGKGSVLTRELSDLEMGEFREPTFGDLDGQKRNTDEKGSKGKDLSKRMPPTKPKTLFNQDGQKRKSSVDDTKDPSKRQRLFNETEDSDGALHLDKLADSSKDVKKADNGGASKKKSVSLGSKFDQQIVKSDVSPKKKQSYKVQKLASNNQHKGNPNLCANGRKKWVPLSDQDFSAYFKYEKNEPHVKTSIKDHALYEECVKEYREMYDRYCSLLKILDDCRNYFEELGLELDRAKGKDEERYVSIAEQLKELYAHNGTIHKKLKVIFLILHEEIKHIKQRIKEYAATYSQD